MSESVSLEAVVAEATSCLAAAGVSGARREARLLMVEAGAIPLEDQISGRVGDVSRPVADRFRTLTKRRTAGEPLSRIRGRREFWSLDFELSDATLDPRPDSECLVETILGRLVHRHDSRLRVLDLGTGSGCLLLALLNELPEAIGVGVDRSGDAVVTARRNAKRLGVGDRTMFAVADWVAPIDGVFDVVVTNPPYIPTWEVAHLAAEVRLHDPVAALDGGDDGLDAYREIAKRLPHLLHGDGFAVMETARGASCAVEAILEAAGLKCVGVGLDLAHIKRCVVAVSELARRSKKRLD